MQLNRLLPCEGHQTIGNFHCTILVKTENPFPRYETSHSDYPSDDAAASEKTLLTDTQ
jgi:hypothetical protein